MQYSLPESDPLWKLRWYIDHLVKNFKDTYIPNEHVTVDKSMVKFKGRLAFRQYLPSKPTKWGVKVWSLCESSTGYTWNFQIYTDRVAGQQEHGLSYRVVMQLTEDLQGSYMKVMMDNFYMGVELLEALRVRGLLACGTVHANRRGLPANLLTRNIRLQRGEFRLAQKDDLMCSVWMDTKPVLILSNYHSPAARCTVERRNAQGVRGPVVVPKALGDYQVHMKGVRGPVVVPKALGDYQVHMKGVRGPVVVPKALGDYQVHMKGVDLCDQMTGYHLINHRSKKWWRRLYFYLQMVAVHNAYIVAKESNPAEAATQWPVFQDFVEDLSLELIGDVRSARAAPPCTSTSPSRNSSRNSAHVREI